MKRQLENDSHINRPAKRFMSSPIIIGEKTNPIVIDDEIILYGDRNIDYDEIILHKDESDFDGDDLVITVKDIIPTQRKFDETIIRRKQEPQIIKFEKIGNDYFFNRSLCDIANVTIDCRNVIHYDGNYVPSRGGEKITIHNAVDVANEIMELICSLPLACGAFCVLTDLLGPTIIDIIANELYNSCKLLSRSIIILSYTGNKSNGDDICMIKLNMPIITNDLMNKHQDVYFSEHDSHDYRFVTPLRDQSTRISRLIVNRHSIKSY